MLKYCKILNENIGLVQLGAGCSDEYYIEIGMQERDVEQSEIDNKWYLSEKCPHYSEAELLKQAKESKLQENDNLRDNALNYGVVYRGILFDSDTDQKVNLIDTYSILKDDETIIWLGKNNEPLECNKIDLNNIGNLIRHRTTQIWGLNAQIKEMIKQAKTIE